MSVKSLATLFTIGLVLNTYATPVQFVNTKKVMHEALNSLSVVLPYASSELKFTDPSNEKKIRDHLNKISRAFKAAKHVQDLKKPGFSPNFKVIKDHLEDTTLNFNNNNKSFARLKLASTTSLCLSCHTQIPKDQMTSFIIDKNQINQDTFENKFEYANFMFLLRNYKKAIKSYEGSIEQRFKKVETLKKVQKILGENDQYYDKLLHKSFKNVLTIYAKILREPNKAIIFFDKYLKDKRVPRYIISDLKRWKKDVKKWESNIYIKQPITSDKALQKFIMTSVSPIEESNETIISGKFDVDLLFTSGVLTNYLSRYPKTKLAPEILYWSGLTENRLNKNMFFTIGDLYLKECINRYPKSKMAIRCYNEYENEVQFRFTGTIGTKIPDMKKKELEALKKMIK